MPWRESPQHSASPRAVINAKILRRSLTEQERRLWRHLRDRLPIHGSHFRRQVALGPYVVDFCCLSERLIIEIDGGQHTTDSNIAYDESRTAFFEKQGFRILRFPNAVVMREIDTVLDTIFAALHEMPPRPLCGEGLESAMGQAASHSFHPAPPPPPTSSPQGGGENAEP